MALREFADNLIVAGVIAICIGAAMGCGAVLVRMFGDHALYGMSAFSALAFVAFVVGHVLLRVAR